ncbi:MAG: hypothetical protein PGN08_00215 [Sphingomonas taxi]
MVWLCAAATVTPPVPAVKPAGAAVVPELAISSVLPTVKARRPAWI